jgi:hypothetical protein
MSTTIRQSSKHSLVRDKTLLPSVPVGIDIGL